MLIDYVLPNASARNSAEETKKPCTEPIGAVSDVQVIRLSLRRWRCRGLCNGDVAFCVAAELCESDPGSCS